MACCLMATSHHLNQCWISSSEVLLQSPESNSTASAQATTLYDLTVSVQATFLYIEFEKYAFKITATSPRSLGKNFMTF